MTTLIVGRLDWLGWMNVELVEAALSAHGRQLVAVADDDDLLDVVKGAYVEVYPPARPRWGAKGVQKALHIPSTMSHRKLSQASGTMHHDR